MMRPSPVQSASHSAKIPMSCTVYRCRTQVLQAKAHRPTPVHLLLRSTTLTVPLCRSTGLLGNPPVFSLLVTGLRPIRAGSWMVARQSQDGEDNYYDDVLLFCRCYYLGRLTLLAHIFVHFEKDLCLDAVLGLKPLHLHPGMKLTTLCTVKTFGK